MVPLLRITLKKIAAKVGDSGGVSEWPGKARSSEKSVVSSTLVHFRKREGR